jgi:hypothetical protein
LGQVILEEKPHFKVRITDSEAAHKLVQRVKTPLTILQVNLPSLEEAYIKLIKDKEEV